MLRRVRKLFRSESGQGMSEYLIIVALIAVAAIGVVSVFGKDIRELFAGTTDSLSGGQGKHSAAAAKTKNKTLKDFGSNSATGD
jgi:pilus assembly protein Flp/PilA